MVSLQQVLRKYNYKAPSGVHLPALLRYGTGHVCDWSKLTIKTRCTIRLLTQSVEDDSASDPASQEEICKLFEGGMSGALDRSSRSNTSEGAKQAKASWNHPDNLFNAGELAWFSRNSYNLAIKYCTDWDNQLILRLTRACLEVVYSFAFIMLRRTYDLAVH